MKSSTNLPCPLFSKEGNEANLDAASKKNSPF
jgi:hypothetical protein